jgi:5'-nucleotidase
LLNPQPFYVKFIEKYVDVVAVGNHDVSNAKDLAKMFNMADIEHKFVSANMSVDKGSPLDGKIAKSIIVEDGDEKIGFIGLSPMDFHKCVAQNANNDFVSVAKLLVGVAVRL